MARAALFCVAVAASVASACLPPRVLRDYPRWRIVGGQTLAHDCLRAEAYIRKSGKAGIGVTLVLRSLHDCPVEIRRAELVFPDGRRGAAAAPARALTPLVGRSLRYHWLPVPFDNDRAWDDGAVDATLELELAIAGQPVTWRMPAQHRWDRRWNDTRAVRR